MSAPTFDDWLTRHGPGGTLRRSAGPAQITLHETGELRGEPLPVEPERHETVRLFEPAPNQMPGQLGLGLD